MNRQGVRFGTAGIYTTVGAVALTFLQVGFAETISVTSPEEPFFAPEYDTGYLHTPIGKDCVCETAPGVSYLEETSDSDAFAWSRHNFVIRRTDRVLTLSPDIAKYTRQHESDVKLTGHADRRTANLELTGKVRGEDARFSRLFGVNVVDRTSIWMKADVESAEKNDREFEESFVSLGVDYRLNRQTTIGFVGQYDFLDDRKSAEWRFQEGWLMGPYLISHLTKSLVLDARAAWGEAIGQLSDDNVAMGEFETDRFMAVSQLSGNFTIENWRLNPALSVSWFEEGPEASGAGAFAPEARARVEVGRVSFGPSVSRKFFLFNQYEVEPTFHLKGAWDFDPAGMLDTATGLPRTVERLRARFEGVFTAQLSEKRRFIMDGYYDGVGVSGLNTYGLKIGMAVSLR